MLNSMTDRTLLQLYQSGREEAASVLYGRYAERLDQLASRGLGVGIRASVGSEDVVQSIFRTFFRRAAVGDYEVPEDIELWNLLATISMNKIREIGRYHRRLKRDVGRTVALDDQAGDASLAGADEVACHVLQMVVDEMIEQLPAAHQQIIRLHIEGWNVPEISAESKRSKRTIERVLQEFRQQLKNQILSDGDAEISKADDE